MAGKEALTAAKKAKNDEFYTQLSDIEDEVKYYKKHFKNKIVFCNCDDPEWSNFWKYFSMNFDHLHLKKLIATHYEAKKQSYKLEMFRDKAGVHTEIKTLEQNGDFRSPESIELLKECDIVVTNPPFSLFREYVAQLVEYKKKFIIIGNKNAIGYKEIFPLLKNNKMWVGMKPMGSDMLFDVTEEYAEWLKEHKKKGSAYRIVDGVVKGRASAIWFTNLDIPKKHEQMILYKTYTSEDYPKYDNYDAIDVSKTVNIPCDYNGQMGVPISFMDKYNPDQFEIIGIMSSYDLGLPFVDKKGLFTRIVIKKKAKKEDE